MDIEIRDGRFLDIVDENAKVNQLLTGFVFTEGLAWHPYERHLTFSDIRGDEMFRWFPDDSELKGELKSHRKPSHKANGNTYDLEGCLLTCEHVTSRVVREEPDGSLTIVTSHYGDKELNSPNDIIVKSNGRIYFTDPPSGRTSRSGVERPQDLDFQGIFRVDPDGKNLTLLDYEGYIVPNGLCFSLDESKLFVNDTRRDHIRVYDVSPEETVSGGEVWAETTPGPGNAEGYPDGMKIDSAGNLYCTGPGGIHVFTPDAVCIGVIRTPERPSNLTWGGHDMQTLFMSAFTSIYHTRVKIPGNKLF